MNLSPETPAWIRSATDLALFLHVGAASLALVAGSAALVLPKGSTWHRRAGTAFFPSMLVMTALGAALALATHVPGSALAGAFAFYLTGTGWAAARRGDGASGRFEVGALVFALILLGATLLHSAITAMAPVFVYMTYAFAAVVALAAASDLRVIRRRELAGPDRIARHLWRMCLALMLAFGSFAGQTNAQPEFLRGSPMLVAPGLLILIAMIFWLARVRSSYGRWLTPIRSSPAASR
jgi:hypothetical protein